jgi:DNA-binding beta-propeller fold protein YncE
MVKCVRPGRWRSVLAALCCAAASLPPASPVHAATTDVLIGLDDKVSSGPDGLVNGAPGKDELLVMDVTKPAKPVLRARLPLMNSVLGPPTNLQIAPDGKLGLIANSVLNTPDAKGFAVAPDNRLFVVDLTAAPPKPGDTVTVGKQPSGIAIAHKGDLALVANRAGRSVSVLSISGSKVAALAEVPVEQEAAAVAIAPDGRRAFVCLNLANRIGVLTVAGQTVTYDKTFDIPVAFNPYNVDVTPDGKFVIVSTTGAGKNNGDTMAVIDATGPHPHVVALMTAGTGPEGFAISPDGKWVAAALIGGSGAKQGDWFKTPSGELALMALDPKTGEMTVKSRAPVGGLPEGVAFSPKSDYVYVGNFFDGDLQVFRVAGNGSLKAIEPHIKLGGQPASMRGLAH